MVFVMVSFVTFMRLTSLPNLAEILPAEETTAFITLNLDDYLSSTDKPSPLISELLTYETFLGDHIAFALISDEIVPLLEVDSKSSAKEFLETALITDYIFLKDFLITSPSTSVREALDSSTQTVEQTDSYQNARGRLPYFSSAYAYVDLQAARMDLVRLMGDVGIYEPGYLETILNIFPALGLSIDMNPSEWDAEVFMAVDKSQLNGEAFFKHKLKYRHEFLGLSSNGYAFEWGGHDLAAQLTRTSELLAILNESASLAFDGGVKEYISSLFGSELTLEEIYAALGGEYYLGWTPSEKLLLILELEDETAFNQAQNLKDYFANNYTHTKTYETENGEIRAEIKDLKGTSASYNDMNYFRFGTDEETFIRIAISENHAIVSTSEEEFFATLDKIQTGQNLRDTSDLGKLLSGADEISSLDLEFFEEGHILRSLLDNFGKITASRKIFDDGVYSRYSITLEQSESD